MRRFGCLPASLRSALNEVARRYGPVTVVSTKHLNTRNHAAGSARHKLHEACKAVDFRVDVRRVPEVKAFLRTRNDVAGVEHYRDGVIHTGHERRPRRGTPRAPLGRLDE